MEDGGWRWGAWEGCPGEGVGCQWGLGTARGWVRFAPARDFVAPCGGVLVFVARWVCFARARWVACVGALRRGLAWFGVGGGCGWVRFAPLRLAALAQGGRAREVVALCGA